MVLFSKKVPKKPLREIIIGHLAARASHLSRHPNSATPQTGCLFVLSLTPANCNQLFSKRLSIRGTNNPFRSPNAEASGKHYYNLPNESRARSRRLSEAEPSLTPQKVRRQSFGKCLGLFIAQAVFCLLFFKKVRERNADKLLVMKQNIYQ